MIILLKPYNQTLFIIYKEILHIHLALKRILVIDLEVQFVVVKKGDILQVIFIKPYPLKLAVVYQRYSL